MHPFATVLTVGALAGAALLVPSAASADTNSYWSTPHQESQAHARVVDPGNHITWTVRHHKITVMTPALVMVPFVYTCGTTDDPQGVRYDPAAFQDVYQGAKTAAFPAGEGVPEAFPLFTCDGTQHVTEVVLPTYEGAFENGNVEVGLIEAELGQRPSFEHAIVGHDDLHDSRASVAVTVNATPESTRAGSKITVKGTVKRKGKAYQGKAATLYFQNEVGDPATRIGSARASRKGKLTIKATVTGPGTYFWTTASTSKTQAGASLGDRAAAGGR